MIVRLIVQAVVWIAFTGAVLFISAGATHWPGAWALLVILLAGSLTLGFWLAIHDPALLQKRMGSLVQKDQVAGDRVLMPILLVAFYGWCAVMGLDAVRFGWTAVSPGVQMIGAVLVVAALYAAYRVFRENSFAAPVVKIQSGQTVISTGPYAIVRHPMYAGVLPMFVGMPLLLGSLWGLLAAPVIALLLAYRIGIEEKTLRAAFPDYEAYAARVRFRLLPGVW